jgi:pseudouridylate synthase
MLKLKSSVQEALDEGKPVVALESTIIAHGLPFPDNLNLARNVERLVTMNGATPATIAVIGGELCVGLDDDVLERFAKEGPKIPKLTTRDLPIVVAQKLSGATTVSATMRVAEMAGIHVFATGGIGGAHRGCNKTFDISNDLHEFTQSNVAVVTAGAKAILDLAVTLEVLETYGVPVVGFGTDDFPAFYSRTSGLKVPMRCNTALEVATLMKTKWNMAMPGGLIIANPINPEFEIPNSDIAPATEAALKEADEKQITGKRVTPFLLGRIAEITQGKSIRANLALVLNNAKLATEIAVAYAGLKDV